MSAHVAAPGFLTTVQDLGRPGYREFGVSAGGATDAFALRVANLLVGNEEADAGLEITLGGLRLTFTDDRQVAWCGGAFDVTVADSILPAGRAYLVRAGETLSFGRAETGCRAWLAISGGIDVPNILGSRATDVRGGFGGYEGRALKADDQLPLSPSPSGLPNLTGDRVATWGAPSAWALPSLALAGGILRVIRGSDWERFSGESHSNFLGQPFTVSPESDRMGARLTGITFQRVDGSAELLSEPVAPGTIQVPAAGNPIVLLPDCQTIGGYPKVAHVITVDLAVAAQLRPGDHVQFREIPIAEAHRLLLARERDLSRFRLGLSLRT